MAESSTASATAVSGIIEQAAVKTMAPQRNRFFISSNLRDDFLPFQQHL
jgi:hypothetical protein